MGAAFSLSECAVIRVPSISMTTQPSRDLPATSSHGNPPAASIRSHTCLRILALACATFSSTRSEARFRTRRTVEPDGAAPSTGCANAASSSAVRPHWSASLRSSIPPACPTRPFPSAVTVRPWSQPLSCMAKSAPVPWRLPVVW